MRYAVNSQVPPFPLSNAELGKKSDPETQGDEMYPDNIKGNYIYQEGKQ